MARRTQWGEGWTSYEAYLAAEANILKEPHPFVLDHTLDTRIESTPSGADMLVVTSGEIFCRSSVVAEITIYAETRRRGRPPRREIRPISLIYEAYVAGQSESTILRYDDHGREDWHVHVRDSQGVLIRREITRANIPTVSELLSELAAIFS